MKSVAQNLVVIFLMVAILPMFRGLADAQVLPGMAMPQQPSTAKYFDITAGKTADDLVKLALANNAELTAMRKEAEAGESLLRQARLRPNPTLDISGTQQIPGTDKSLMVQGEIPLELGNRRGSRVLVASRELEVRRLAVAERERQLSADVRTKFGETLAAIFKLSFAEDMLASVAQSYDLVAAKVTEGRTPPLEQNLEAVELNKTRAEREMSEGAVETRMFELRNMAGMTPEEPLKIKGDFDDLLTPLPAQADATALALAQRPDLAGARAVEDLAAARVEQARAEGRFDADVMLGYQQMRSSFPLMGTQEGTGALLPIDSKFKFFTFGVKLMVPVRNRNQGMIAAAQLDRDAARDRREFGELTIKREVAVAYARYNRASRAMEIYRSGVRDKARENLDVVRQTYELGSKTLLDYIGEHHRYTAAELGFIDAELETYLARIELLKAIAAAELLNK